MGEVLQPGADVELVIEKPVAGGRMLARHDGRIVFVAGAIPGERVRARVTHVSRQSVFAVATGIVEASEDRRPGDVDWACGGSLYAHIAYARQQSLKSEVIADALARIGRIRLEAPVPVLASEERGYRMRARLHVAEGRFGFFREGSHDWCHAAATRQLLPATIDALASVEAVLHASGVRPLSCELSENAPADERVVLLELNAPLPPLAAAADGVTGFAYWDGQHQQIHTLHGSPFVTDHVTVQGQTVAVGHHVQSFFQGNRFLLQTLVDRVLTQVAGHAVLELYAGVGLFTVSMAAEGRQVIAVEGDRSAARDLDGNAASLADRIRVEHTSVERFLGGRRLAPPDTVLLDPPRTGVSREALTAMMSLRAPRLVYLSCDVATLARDLRRLLEAGYVIEHVEAFDLFPNTPHIETLVTLVRRVA